MISINKNKNNFKYILQILDNNYQNKLPFLNIIKNKYQNKFNKKLIYKQLSQKVKIIYKY